MAVPRVRYYVVRPELSGGKLELSRLTWADDGSTVGHVWCEDEWLEDDGVIRDVIDLVVEEATAEQVNESGARLD